MVFAFVTGSDDKYRKGVADEELAKKEAERARKRELEKDDEDEDEPNSREPLSKRQRSESVNSVSTISTRSSKSPPPRRRSPSPHQSPPRRTRDISPALRSGRSRSLDSVSDGERRDAPSPARSHHRRPHRERRPSPRREGKDRRYGREGSVEQGHPRGSGSKRSSSILSDEGRPRRPRRHDSRSPVRSPERPPPNRFRERPRQDHFRDYHNPSREAGRDSGRGEPPKAAEPPRERSLSPFSKRLALTQAMNSGGR